MKKIFIGTVNIAGQISLLEDGFKALGYEVVTVVHNNQEMFDLKASYNISKMKGISFRGIRPRKFQDYLNINFGKKKRLLDILIKECDIFIYMWSGISDFLLDFEILKKANKKIVTLNVGGDVRWYSAMKQEFEKYGLELMKYSEDEKWNKYNLEKKLRMLRYCEKYADLIFSAPNQAQLALRDYFVFSVPVPPDLINSEYKAQKEIPKIVHAPTYMTFKGTDIIIDTLNKLLNEGIRFDFQLVTNIINNNALKIYEEADIIIDQLYAVGGGKLAREGLALGKVVVSAMGRQNNYDQGIISKAPIVDVNSQNLYFKLKKLILNKELRERIALKGKKFIIESHSPVKLAERIIELLNNPDIKPDIKPSFFRYEFIPENKSYAKVYNKWTKFVSDCDWYKNNVKPGKRNGLEF